MGVLDTFVFLLETDNRNAMKGLKDTDSAFDDLQATGEKSTKAIKNSVNAMGNSISDVATRSVASLGAMAAGMLGAVAAGASISGVIDQLNQQVVRAQNAASVGIDIGQYDALEGALGAVGLEADDVRDTMMDLNEFLGDPEGAEKWKALGINIKDANGQLIQADEAMLRLAGSVEKMGAQEATAKLRELGVSDPRVIGALMQGREELERLIRLRKALGVQNDEDTGRAQKFKSATGELTMIFSAMAERLASAVAPALTAVVDGFMAVVEWGQRNKPFLISLFGVLAFVAIPAVTTALWGMAAAAVGAVIPFLPLIGIIAVLALAVDDLYAYFSGGESVIGDLAAKFPILKSALDGAKESVLAAWEALKLLFSNPSQFMDVLVAELQASWDEIVNGVVDAGDAIGKALDKAWKQLTADTKKVFNDLLAWVKSIFSQIGTYISDAVSNAGKAAYDKLPDFMKKAINAVKGEDEPKPAQPTPGGPDMAVPGDEPFVESARLAGKANSAIATAAAMPVIPNGAGRTSNVSNSQTVNVDKVEVHTQATDAQGIANSMTDGLKNAYGDMANQYDDGRSH